LVVVPPIDADRYYAFQFLDAYTNDVAYVGTLATASDGGTYPITATRGWGEKTSTHPFADT
jgi:hypothetical protein